MSNYSLTLNTTAASSSHIKVDLLNIKKAAMVIGAINHKLRQQILKLIDKTAK